MSAAPGRIEMFGGIQIRLVEPGTVVGRDHKGVEMIVTDNNAVFNGNIAWVTPKTYEAIKAKAKVV